MSLDEMQFCANADSKGQESLQESRVVERKCFFPGLEGILPGLLSCQDVGEPF